MPKHKITTLRFDPDTYREFQIQLIRDGLSMQEWVNRKVAEYLKNNVPAF